MIVYVNTSALGLLTAYPRAVYRVTMERAGVSALSYATGLLRWRTVVTEVIDAIGRSRYGIVLGTPLPSDADRTAVIEVRAPTAPGTADSVSGLVTAANAGSPYARVVRVERLPPVPGAGSAAEAERQAGREAEQDRAERAQGPGFFARVLSIGNRLEIGLAVGLAVLVIGGGLYLGRQAAKIGDAAHWD